MPTATAPKADPAVVLTQALLSAGDYLGLSKADLGAAIGKERTVFSRSKIAPDTKAGELALMLLQLLLQPLEQGEGVGGGAGEACDHRAVAEPAHLARIVLDNGLAKGHLSVAGNYHLAVLTHRQDRRAVPKLVCRVRHVSQGQG